MTSTIYSGLAGRVVLITGGASGIGAAFVRAFAAQKARVAFLDIDTEAGAALVRDVASECGAAPLFVPCDLLDIDALRRAIMEIHGTLGNAAVLVNNAANDQRQALTEVTPAEFDWTMAVNLRHVFFAAQAVAPAMRARKRGSIINLGSITWHAGFADVAAYATAKAGIEGLTRSLARDLGASGIRVNCLIPGWTMTERQLAGWVTPEAEREIDRAQCLPGRVMPADIARMALWPAADDSRMCTSQTWVVDGGWI